MLRILLVKMADLMILIFHAENERKYSMRSRTPKKRRVPKKHTMVKVLSFTYFLETVTNLPKIISVLTRLPSQPRRADALSNVREEFLLATVIFH